VLGQAIKRGTIDIFVSRKSKTGVGRKMEYQQDVAKSYLAMIKKISKDLKVDTRTVADQLIRLPEVIQYSEVSEIPAAEVNRFKKAFEQAVEKCVLEKKREGSAIQANLMHLSSELEKSVESIAKLRHDIQRELEQRYRERIIARLKSFEIEQAVKVDDSRLVQEIAHMIEKSDVAEELQRLDEHLSHFAKELKKPDVEGKKLDFYIQELLREVNTIGSKSQLAAITTHVIQAKAFIEKLREQVQNVE
ncbi:MAG: YicC family protein, partial [Pseudobdellovibrionaceae bacterium]